jgi:hypothetical protein
MSFLVRICPAQLAQGGRRFGYVNALAGCGKLLPLSALRAKRI